MGLGGGVGLHPDAESGDLDLSPPLLAVWQSHSQTWRFFFPLFICYKRHIKPVSQWGEEPGPLPRSAHVCPQPPGFTGGLPSGLSPSTHTELMPCAPAPLPPPPGVSCLV